MSDRMKRIDEALAAHREQLGMRERLVIDAVFDEVARMIADSGGTPAREAGAAAKAVLSEWQAGTMSAVACRRVVGDTRRSAVVEIFDNGGWWIRDGLGENIADGNARTVDAAKLAADAWIRANPDKAPGTLPEAFPRAPVDDAEREAVATTTADAWCDARRGDDICTRRPHRHGDHVCAGFVEVCARWPSATPAPGVIGEARPLAAGVTGGDALRLLRDLSDDCNPARDTAIATVERLARDLDEARRLWTEMCRTLESAPEETNTGRPVLYRMQRDEAMADRDRLALANADMERRIGEVTAERDAMYAVLFPPNNSYDTGEEAARALVAERDDARGELADCMTLLGMGDHRTVEEGIEALHNGLRDAERERDAALSSLAAAVEKARAVTIDDMIATLSALPVEMLTREGDSGPVPLWFTKHVHDAIRSLLPPPVGQGKETT